MFLYFFLTLRGYEDGSFINQIKLHCTRNLKGFREVLIIDRTKFKNKIVTYIYVFKKNKYFIETQVLIFFYLIIILFTYATIFGLTKMFLFHIFRNIPQGGQWKL